MYSISIINLLKNICVVIIPILFGINNAYTQRKDLKEDTIIFKGKIKLFEGEKSIRGVKVYFITLEDIFISKTTEKDGKFSIEIPKSKVLDNNLIRLVYPFCNNLEEYFIIKKRKINSFFKKSRLCNHQGFFHGSYEGEFTFSRNDLVIKNGKKIKFDDYNKEGITIEKCDIVIMDEEIINDFLGINNKKALYLFYDKKNKFN